MRFPTPVYRYPLTTVAPVWDTGKLSTHAFWNGMEPTVRFVWTIPTEDTPSKYLFSKQVSVIVRGKEHMLSVFTFFIGDNVYIGVLYRDGQNECQACKLDVRFALQRFVLHDQTVDAAERSLGVGIQLPHFMLLGRPFRRVNNWRDPEQIYYASSTGKAAYLDEFTQLVVCANICFVASDA